MSANGPVSVTRPRYPQAASATQQNPGRQRGRVDRGEVLRIADDELARQHAGEGADVGRRADGALAGLLHRAGGSEMYDDLAAAVAAPATDDHPPVLQVGAAAERAGHRTQVQRA